MSARVMMPRRSGFTLIELLIVMIVIAILATIGLTHYWNVKDRSLMSVIQSDLRNLASEQEIYFNSNYSYTGTLMNMPDFAPSNGVNITVTYSAQDGWAANATHVSLTALSCGLFTGNAPAASGAPATTNGVIECN
jgi:prepilin-type N-terminal cleavage/methylation domain-containing protein